MGQEFFINSQELEDKIRNLLPSQGGAGAGIDLSASTQIVPIIDLTESAEGSNVREDIQKSFSLDNITHTSTDNTTNTIVSNTGYFRIFGSMHLSGSGSANISVTDGVTTKVVIVNYGVASLLSNKQFDFIVFVAAGQSVTATSSSTAVVLSTTTRQIADIDGNLIDPS